MKIRKLSVLDWLFVGSLLAIFGGIVLHAPISVAGTVLLPDYDLLVKSWKEILMGVALVAGAVLLTRYKQWQILNSPIIYAIAAYGLVHLAMIPLFDLPFEAVVAGMFIDLRYVLFFALVYVAIRLYPQLYRPFLWTFFAGAALVIGFAILQVTILPYDVLKYLGYSQGTIVPFMTVDENIHYIRINSTLRGPNPLGVYAVITLAVAVTAWVARRRVLQPREQVLLGILAAGSVVAVAASYSRSAAVAAAVAIGIIILVVYGGKTRRWMWLSAAVLALAVGGLTYAYRDTQFVSQVILHEDPEEGNDINSNDGHAESLAIGTERMLRQPFGAGVGSTGSASLLTDDPLILENQYLYVAHEAGWVGLALFITIIYLVLQALWQRRGWWLALAVFASGIGLSIAALVLPVWADDTVSIIWWGLAALALAVMVEVPATGKATSAKSRKRKASKA